jgi:hypothetical protein
MGSFNLSLIRNLELSWSILNMAGMRYRQGLSERDRQTIQEWRNRTFDEIRETLKFLAVHFSCLNSLTIHLPYLIRMTKVPGRQYRIEMFTLCPVISAEMGKIKGVVDTLRVLTLDYEAVERVARAMGVRKVIVDLSVLHYPSFDQARYLEQVKEMEEQGWRIPDRELYGTKTLGHPLPQQPEPLLIEGRAERPTDQLE